MTIVNNLKIDDEYDVIETDATVREAARVMKTSKNKHTIQSRVHIKLEIIILEFSVKFHLIILFLVQQNP